MKKKKTIFEEDTQPVNQVNSNSSATRPSEQQKADRASQTRTSEQRFNRMANRAERVLYRAKAVFPFDLFPDEIVIDLNKITFVNYTFFFNKFIRSILVKDLANVNVSTSFFFATLHVTDQYFTRDPIEIRYLSRSSAICSRRLIQGLMVANQEKIDFSNMRKEDIYQKLLEIGKIKEESAP